IRIPASFCGVTGLKPTYGRVTRAGVTPLAWTLDHVSPLARSVEDAALLLGVLAGHDSADPTSARVPVPDYAARFDRSLRGVRIGVPRDFACAVVDPEVLRAFEAALGELGHAGATVSEVTVPSLDHAGPALGALILGEARSALAPLCGFTGDGRPIGLQLVGRPFAEADVLAAGHAYQRVTDWHRRRPPG